ncbi:hypothetical protein ISM_08065 [Roseovarius nubinhibens ISM]|uniref:Uncharacterized protein n=2 Tax=Roseovarius nubinhibens TaxID=314263 RepID=A3SLK5_ROSNI|nr:hypothetical protein ISM_08065 [Roseovarius nubinhibens ISM]
MNSGTDFNLFSGPCVELSTKRFDELRKDLEALQALKNEREIEAKFTQLASLFIEKASERPGASSAVKIFRNGETRVIFENDDKLSVEAEHRGASQVFFFLRDVTHSHKHHSPSSDTILDVTPLSEGPQAWKRETLYSLYRWVIHRKRDQSLAELVNCKGVLSYAKAFEEIHCDQRSATLRSYVSTKRALPKRRPFAKLPTYNHQTTMDSVNASIEAQRDRLLRPSFSSTFFSKGLPCFAALISIVSPLYLQVSDEHFGGQQMAVTRVAQWLTANILVVVGGAFLVSFLAMRSAYSKSKFFSSNLQHDLLRVVISLTPKRNFVIAFFLIAILSVLGVALGAAWFAWEAEAQPIWQAFNRV